MSAAAEATMPPHQLDAMLSALSGGPDFFTYQVILLQLADLLLHADCKAVTFGVMSAAAARERAGHLAEAVLRWQ